MGSLETTFPSLKHPFTSLILVQPTNKASCQSQPSMTTTIQQNPSTSSSYDTSSAQMFRRKIKADPTIFPVLKDEKYHDLWHR
jgi:hypothetical protein